MRSRDYGQDVLNGDGRRRRIVAEVPAEPELVVEEAGSGFCGVVVACTKGAVALEDRHGRRRVFPLLPGGFRLDGQPVTLTRPAVPVPPAVRRTASGSIAVAHVVARVARAGRLWVEGLHDAALVERVWGDDLRVEGVVVEPVDGVDALPERVRGFGAGPGRRLGVLVDHLVPDSKESRVAATVAGPYVLVVGHPYVDVWQAVRPAALGIPAWPQVPRGMPWKEGIVRALGAADTGQMWRRVLAAVDSYADLEVPMLRAVEQLIDFVTAD
jgi:hypothetical protein